MEDIRFRFYRGAVDMENEGYNLATKLDTEGGEINPLYEWHFDFSTRYLHRETPFTRMLLKAIMDQEPPEILIPAFLDIWNIDDNVETRALSLLALSSLGHNTALEIYQKSDHEHYKAAIARFLAHLGRVQAELQSAVIRYFLVLQHHPYVFGFYSVRHLSTLEKSVVNRITLELFARAGLPPLHLSDVLPDERSWGFPTNEEGQNAKRTLELNAWLSRIGTYTFDPVGDINAKILSHGDQLAGKVANYFSTCSQKSL
ncbi:MAG: hypothetical protein IPL65_22575 [Lewinellaceae bacterium]|nr:hypothetical protein [Lewinellaceae bacterium]